MKIEVGKVYKTDEPLTGLPEDYAVEVLSEEDKDGWFPIKGLNSKQGSIIHKELFRKTFKHDGDGDDQPVSKPAHYDTAIDTIAFAKANFSREQVEGFMRINAIKYLQRAGKKDDKLSDLRKSAHYLQMLIEMEEEQDETKG